MIGSFNLPLSPFRIGAPIPVLHAIAGPVLVRNELHGVQFEYAGVHLHNSFFYLLSWHRERHTKDTVLGGVRIHVSLPTPEPEARWAVLPDSSDKHNML